MLRTNAGDFTIANAADPKDLLALLRKSPALVVIEHHVPAASESRQKSHTVATRGRSGGFLSRYSRRTVLAERYPGAFSGTGLRTAQGLATRPNNDSAHRLDQLIGKPVGAKLRQDKLSGIDAERLAQLGILA